MHDSEIKILVGISWELCCRRQSKQVLEQWWSMERQKHSTPPPISTKIAAKYYIKLQCRADCEQAACILVRREWGVKLHEVTILCGKILALFPDLPHFTLRFVWTIIHRSGRVEKNVKGLGEFIMWVTCKYMYVSANMVEWSCLQNLESHLDWD